MRPLLPLPPLNCIELSKAAKQICVGANQRKSHLQLCSNKHDPRASQWLFCFSGPKSSDFHAQIITITNNFKNLGWLVFINGFVRPFAVIPVVPISRNANQKIVVYPPLANIVVPSPRSVVFAQGRGFGILTIRESYHCFLFPISRSVIKFLI